MSRRVAYLTSTVAAALLTATIAAPLKAETVDKLAFLTFSGSVQVPGSRLEPGTYRFRLTNPHTSRNVMQVLSRDGSTVYAMFNTIPDQRLSVSSDPTVTFRETPASLPPAVKSLFYGGEMHGYEFVYPKDELIDVTGLTTERRAIPAPPYVSVTESSTRYEPAPEPAFAESTPAIAESAASDASSAESSLETAAAPEPEATAAVSAEQSQPTELPRTAGPVPFVALGGFVSLLAGFGAGLIRRLIV